MKDKKVWSSLGLRSYFNLLALLEYWEALQVGTWCQAEMETQQDVLNAVRDILVYLVILLYVAYYCGQVIVVVKLVLSSKNVLTCRRRSISYNVGLRLVRSICAKYLNRDMLASSLQQIQEVRRDSKSIVSKLAKVGHPQMIVDTRPRLFHPAKA